MKEYESWQQIEKQKREKEKDKLEKERDSYMNLNYSEANFGFGGGGSKADLSVLRQIESKQQIGGENSNVAPNILEVSGKKSGGAKFGKILNFNEGENHNNASSSMGFTGYHKKTIGKHDKDTPTIA